MNLDSIHWKSLERLRAVFLNGTAGRADYWRDESDLQSYDQTFGQRIRWKWDYVLAELKRRGWSPTQGAVLDWGCGSGIAGRAYLQAFGCDAVTDFRVWDRSPMAMRYAIRRVTEEYPNIRCAQKGPEHESWSVLLVSHVLTELSEAQRISLIALAERATTAIWVEPGAFETSRALLEIREWLLRKFFVVAPCTHQAACGMLAPGNESHWCHHFAPPPPEVFTDGNWARFAHLMEIDLRSLPLSFLVLDKRPPPPLPAGATRVIGKPRVYKAHALLFGCDESGVKERRLMKRASPQEFRRVKKGLIEPLQVWECEADEIRQTVPLEFAGGNQTLGAP